MSRKESRFYVTNFIDPWINLKKKINKTCDESAYSGIV